MTMLPDTRQTCGIMRSLTRLLIMSGTAVEPDFWTEYFGVQPDSTITKGKPYLLSVRQVQQASREAGLLGYREREGRCGATGWNRDLRYLTGILKLPRDDLRDRIGQDGVKMSLWCYWYNETGDRVPGVPDDLREMMESLGGVIEIDEYR